MTTGKDRSTEPVSLRLKRGLRGQVAHYAESLGRNFNSQMEFWAQILLESPDLSVELEKRANALATGRSDDPPRSKPESPPGDVPRRGRLRGKAAGAR